MVSDAVAQPSEASLRRVKIAGLSTYVPPKVLTNDDLEKLVDTSNEWILQRTGIRERHIVEPGVATSDLAKEAAIGAMRQAGVTPDQIGFIVVGTTTPDTIFPEHRVHAAAQDRRAPRLGLRPRRRLFRIHLCADDRHADGRDRRARPRAGGRRRRDVEHHRLHAIGRRACCSATAPARSCSRRRPTTSRRIIDFAHEIDGSGGPALCMPAGGSRLPASHETVDQRLHYVKQDGAGGLQVRRPQDRGDRAARCSPSNGIDASEIDLFVSHQANRRIITAAAERLGLPESKVIINLEMYGNTTAGDDPAGARRRGRAGAAEEGRPGAARSVGAGFTVGAVLLRWSL